MLLAPAAIRAAEAGAQQETATKSPITLAPPASFDAAAGAVEKATGAKAERLPFGDIPLAEGCSFAIDHAVAGRLIAGSHDTFKQAGFFLFRYERSYGMAGEKDRVGLLKTTDHRAVVRRVGTGLGHGLASEKVVAWLDALGKDEPFELSEIGTDYVFGRFERTPKDPKAVAKRCAEFAPELVAGKGAGLDLLTEEIRANRTLYLIW